MVFNIENKLNRPIKIENPKLYWGKWCNPEDKEKKVPAPNGEVAKNSNLIFAASSWNDTPTSVEGTFDLIDKKNNQVIRQIYFISTFFGTNDLKITGGSDNYIVVQRGANLDRGILGTIQLTVAERE